MSATKAHAESPWPRADKPAARDAHDGLYVSAAPVIAAGVGHAWISRTPGVTYGALGTPSGATFGGGGFELAVGHAVRRDLALAGDLSVLLADRSDAESGANYLSTRALGVLEWYRGAHLHFRGGAGLQTGAIIKSGAPGTSSVCTASSPCLLATERPATHTFGPALLAGVGTNLGRPGETNVTVGVDLGAAYLTSGFDHFLPLTATFRVGATYF